MFSNRLAFAAISLASVVAAGGGAYFATRQNAADVPSASPEAVVAQEVSQQAAAAAPDTQPVQETEGLVGDVEKRAEPAPKEPVGTSQAECHSAFGRTGETGESC